MRKGGLLNGCKTLQNRTKKLIRQGNGLGATPPYHYLYHIICITGDDVRNIIQHHLWYGNNRIRSNEKLHEQQFITVTLFVTIMERIDSTVKLHNMIPISITKNSP